jgi:hypothetical protein
MHDASAVVRVDLHVDRAMRQAAVFDAQSHKTCKQGFKPGVSHAKAVVKNREITFIGSRFCMLALAGFQLTGMPVV